MTVANIASLEIVKSVDTQKIKATLDEHQARMKLSLAVCAHCSLCAESCFLYTHTKDPKYMPSHKFLNSVGTLYRKKGKVDRADLEKIGDIVFNRCVLCTRCYCPFGIDIPAMIALGRDICRSQGIVRTYDVAM
jgi:Fe-S oxidoreductase